MNILITLISVLFHSVVHLKYIHFLKFVDNTSIQLEKKVPKKNFISSQNNSIQEKVFY